MRDIYFRFRTNLTKALHGPPLVVYTISRAVHKVSRVFAKEAEGIGRSSLAVQLSRLFGIPERSVAFSFPVRNVVPTVSVPPMGGFQWKG